MKVVLVEPEIPFNTGSIGRTCVALELELILIGQLGFSLDSSSVARSGTRYWNFVQISLYESWDEFLQKRSPLIDQLYLFEEDGSKSFYTPIYHPEAYLVFGCESKGLPTSIRENMKDRIFIIDGSSYLYRAYHAMPPLTTSTGQPTGAIKGVTNMLMTLKKDSEGSPIIVVFDAKGKTFRNDIYADYKANRPPMPDELKEQLKPVKSICKAIGFPLVEIAGVEADDVIATISRMAKEAKYKCVISSLDKDLMQLVEDPHTTMMDTMKHKIFNEEGVFEKFGVKPNQIRDMLALVGDTSDNIPGIPKVGQKTAAKWLKEYGDLEGIKKNADSIPGVVGENLRNSLNDLDRNVELVSLKDNVDINLKFKDLLQFSPDEKELDKIFSELEFKAADKNKEKKQLKKESNYEIASHGWRWIDYQNIPKAKEKKHMQLAISSIKKIFGLKIDVLDT